MDHLDWFGPGSPEVDVEISELFRVLEPGGIVLWRSAAKHPWYNKKYVLSLNRHDVTLIAHQLHRGRILGDFGQHAHGPEQSYRSCKYVCRSSMLKETR